MNRKNVYSRSQLSGLVILRILIGWYFMYEGLAKVFNPNWSSYPYLLDSKGLFAPIFISLTDYPFLSFAKFSKNISINTNIMG
jgi:thiosulfate dehydrogenase [quinone] large subunit